MGQLKKPLISSIGKKMLMACTGSLLSGFVLVHLLGNFTLLAGPEVFNRYAYHLTSLGPLLYLAELGLVVIFCSHIGLGISVWMNNQSARPDNYYFKASSGKGETFASRLMPVTGSIMLIFLLAHLFHFKWGATYVTTINGVEMRNLYQLLMEYFSRPLNVAWYILAMVAISLHTSHGLWSAGQSLGLNHPKYNPLLKTLALVYAFVTGGGFCFLALWAYFQKGV